MRLVLLDALAGLVAYFFGRWEWVIHWRRRVWRRKFERMRARRELGAERILCVWGSSECRPGDLCASCREYEE